MESTQPSSPVRSWRLSIPVSLGVVLLLSSLLIAAVSLRSHAGDRSPAPSPTPTASKPGDDHSWMSLGYVDTAGGVTPLYPLQQGRVKSIDVHENERVKKGTPLLHLEDTVQAFKVREANSDLRAARERLELARAKVKQLEQQIAAQQEAIAAAELTVKQARLQFDKEKRFQEKGISGDPETVQNADLLLQKAEVGVRVEKKKLAALEAGREQAAGAGKLAGIDIEAKEAQLEEAQNALNECVVQAPVDGTPLRILVSAGQTLGANPHQPAVQFAAKGPLLVRAEVEQEFAERVRVGDAVHIQDHVTGQECGQGKVVSIAHWYAQRRTASPEMLSVSNDARTLECLVEITSTVHELRIGQRVRVQFPR